MNKSQGSRGLQNNFNYLFICKKKEFREELHVRPINIKFQMCNIFYVSPANPMKISNIFTFFYHFYTSKRIIMEKDELVAKGLNKKRL